MVYHNSLVYLLFLGIALHEHSYIFLSFGLSFVVLLTSSWLQPGSCFPVYVI